MTKEKKVISHKSCCGNITMWWTLSEAQNIALSEIYEHCGGVSCAAYTITRDIFDYVNRRKK